MGTIVFEQLSRNRLNSNEDEEFTAILCTEQIEKSAINETAVSVSKQLEISVDEYNKLVSLYSDLQKDINYHIETNNHLTQMLVHEQKLCREQIEINTSLRIGIRSRTNRLIVLQNELTALRATRTDARDVPRNPTPRDSVTIRNDEYYRGSLYETPTCSICMEILSDVVITTPCKHTYHKTCLDSWIDTGRTAICPLCRAYL